MRGYKMNNQEANILFLNIDQSVWEKVQREDIGHQLMKLINTVRDTKGQQLFVSIITKESEQFFHEIREDLANQIPEVRWSQHFVTRKESRKQDTKSSVFSGLYVCYRTKNLSSTGFEERYSEWINNNYALNKIAQIDFTSDEPKLTVIREHNKAPKQFVLRSASI